MNILSPFESFANEAKTFQSGADWNSKQLSKDSLEAKGLPTRKDESWRNTSLKFLADNTFIPTTHAPEKIPQEIMNLINEKRIPGTSSIVFLNGFYIPSQVQLNGESVSVGPCDPNTNLIPFQGDSGSEALHTLNTIYNLNAIEIRIQKGLVKPLQILNITYSENGKPVVSSPRIQLSLNTNTEAKVILTHVGENNANYFSNGMYTVSVEKDARLELINHTNQSLKSFHFDFVGISGATSSSIRYFELNFNAHLARHEFVLELNGENIRSEILGASYLKGNQHCDSQTFINHNKGHSQSEQVYKAVLDDESRSVFSGTVFIAKGLAKADSAQLNQNLLLSDQAEVNSKPVLRIFSDDVKASHGSTIGQVNEEEIFYLQSRSISRVKAIELLGQGFLNEIVLRIGSDDVKRYFTNELLSEMEKRSKPQVKGTI